MSNKIQPLKIYKKNNKFYGLSDMTTDEWSDEEIIHFAQQLEKYGVTPEFSEHNADKNAHLNDYVAVRYVTSGRKEIQIRESCGFQHEDFEIDFIFGEPDGDGWDDIVYFTNPITPDKVRLVQKNCFLEPDEKARLRMIMLELGLSIDEVNVDNEIKNCVGLYEFIEI